MDLNDKYDSKADLIFSDIDLNRDSPNREDYRFVYLVMLMLETQQMVEELGKKMKKDKKNE